LSRLKAEVAIIGGGPAGAITAHALAMLGRSVILCEASEFPRGHVGISISAGVRQQLAFLALDHLLDRAAHRHGVHVERQWGGASFEPAAGAPVIVADRGTLDADLLAAARQMGVQVRQPAPVRALARAGDGWQLAVRSHGCDLVVEALFVVDATGRRSHFRRRQRQGATTLALCGSWRGTPARAVRVAAQSGSWCWGAPTSPGESILVCFVDPQDFRRAPGSLRERYVGMARSSGVLPGIDDLALADEVLSCDATPYMTEGQTADLLRVGDADVALDPLSSTGVQAAIQSALAAGPIVNTLLTPGEDHAAALEYWRGRRESRMVQHREWARQLYAEAFARHPTGFWAARCGHAPPATRSAPATPLPDPDQPICLAPEARLVLAPCLTGSLVRRLECVDHVNLSGPVAFIVGIHVAPLLRRAMRPVAARDLLAAWSRPLALRDAWSLLAWAWGHDILTAAGVSLAPGAEYSESSSPVAGDHRHGDRERPVQV